MFANYKGNSLFQIFFRQVKVLSTIVKWLQQADFVQEFDKDDNQIENQTLRRIYFVMARHTITDKAFEAQKSSIVDPKKEDAEEVEQNLL